jgi:hypothetical protein
MSDIKKNNLDSVGAPIEAQGITKESDQDITIAYNFKGTKSPRRIRALIALVYQDYVSRESLDRRVGCSNFPDVAFQMKKQGLPIETRIVKAIDRDGRPTHYAEYYLRPDIKAMVKEWLEASGHAERAQHGQR